MIEKKRIYATLIDLILIFMGFSISLQMIELIIISDNIKTIIEDIIFYIAIFLLVGKDLAFKNASIGKKLQHIEITKNNKAPNIFIIILRNIILYLFLPIETMFLVWTGKTITDIIFKTTVK